MPLDLNEKERVRYHLGFLNISPAGAIALGFPSSSQIQFIVDSALNSVLPEAEPGVRRAIQELDCIEDQLSVARTPLVLSAAGGGVKFRGADALIELENQYRWWAQSLADTLGTPVNPFSLKHQQLGTLGGGVVEPT